ncbi:uncharacterized protein C630.12-like isoform X1 [Salvia splendens]|uniref:uncharacterized protein C630.12-like isoform X1 n=1 Tax=Salvia splendens TaxID=180675 RepID=UPI001C25B0A6|nr:uncharacterized protein C630.12-like isoform X1 [Salvia splendens]
MKLTVFLSLFWALNLLYGEWFAYLVPSQWTCSWPHLQRPSNFSPQNGVDYPSSYVKIAVITDPQLIDKTSLPLAPKSLALEVVQFYADLYMRRAFLSSVLPFNPDVILFLGDYFDGSDRLSDEEWQESLGRFKHIFNLNMIQKTSKTKIYYIPGNHDIGYAASYNQKPEIIKRYESEFGARNFKLTIGEVDFIAIDSQTLDGHPQGNFTLDTWGFIENASKDISSTPRVLLTHIPLYRPDWTPCGPHRYSPVINQRINRVDYHQDIVYQNYITEKSSNSLLDLIRPALVLSGHDHDQCTVSHMYNNGHATEHTVGTVSWQQGNLYPSFMLLSAKNSSVSDGITTEDALLTNLCFLPMQVHIYIWYLSLFAMTLVVVLIWPANEVHITRKLGSLMVAIRDVLKSFSSVLKVKNEDENVEYEEIWDAEGSMHLIKKTKKVQVVNESSSVERGNAVMRSKARKQDAEAATSEDVSIHIGLGRTNRSRGKVIMWRLLRALRAVTIVAAFNVPLYVLFVFKDWIDK